jgi:septal ring-binding cell division protein DamX
MEILLIVAIVGILAYIVYARLNRENADGSHPLDAVTIAKVEETAVKTVAEVRAAAAKVEQEVVAVLDVNKDGEVNVDDVKEVVKKTKASAKKAVASVKKTKTAK